MNLIYHIVPAADWTRQADQPAYEAGSLQTEGFIHLSRKEQVAGTLHRYYANVPDLLLLHVDVDRLTHEVNYEVATNGERFPHLYGPLNKEAVVAVEPINAGWTNSLQSYMRAFRIIIPLLVLVALFVFFGVLPRLKNKQELQTEADREKNRVPLVNAVSLKHSSDTTGLSLPGQIQPYRQTPLYARTQGFLRRWYVDIGAQVRQGQLLATIDAPELDQDIARAKADQQLAQTNLDRLQSVQLPGAVAKQDIDTRRSAVTVAQANLGRLRALKDLQQIRAPFTGVITSRTAENGTLVSPGAGQPLFTLSELGMLRVFVDVPQTYYRYIKVGMPATVVIPELQNQTFAGNVVRTSGTLRSESRTLLAEVAIPNPKRELPSGLYSQVKFAMISANAPVLIPANALQMTPEGAQVVVVEPDQRIRFVPITLGRDYGTTLEASSGLTGQELVVTNPNDRLRDGQKVRLRKAGTEKSVASR